MISMEKLIEGFRRSTYILKRQTEGLSNDDSLLQPPFRGSCMNWVLAHMIVSRDDIITGLDAEPFLSPEQHKNFAYESEPILESSDKVLPLSNQLDIVFEQQDKMIDLIESADEAFLLEEIEFAGNSGTRAEMVFYFYFHDTYHTGQLEYLQQLAGTNDKII